MEFNTLTSRNKFFKVIILILFLISNLTATSRLYSTPPEKKPNIIFILTDDQRWDALGYAGNQIIQTPHINARGIYNLVG